MALVDQPKAVTFDPTRAEAAARAVPKTRAKEYADYWRMLRKAMTPEGVWSRWAYAFSSVNLSVAGHLRAYRFALRYPPGLSARMTEAQYVAKFRRARIGGQFKTRAGGIYRFDRLFLADPARWGPARPTPAVRDALAADLYGLGRAKTAFALELVDPLGCTAVCMDRHMLRLFGLPKDAANSGSKVSDAFYEEAEAYWLRLARGRGFSPFVLRSVFWDARVGQRTCRWWSSVFEPWFDPYAWADGRAGFGGHW